MEKTYCQFMLYIFGNVTQWSKKVDLKPMLISYINFNISLGKEYKLTKF